MNTFQSQSRDHVFVRGGVIRLIAAFVFGCAAMQLCGQGTMTVTFEGAARGTQTQLGANPYTDASGMQFGSLTPQSLYLNGGGILGYPDNGTCYLEIPAGSLRFGYNTFPPGNIVPFTLVSFDGAEYDNFGSKTLEVVGYHPMAGTVTNYFTVSSQTFQTFYLDSSFTNVFQVDVLNASWSLDDVVINGVPEPSTGALLALGALFGVRYMRSRRIR